MSVNSASSAAVSIDTLGLPTGDQATASKPDMAELAAPPEQELENEKRPESAAERWLDWQCRMLSGVNCGAVFLIRSEGYGGFKPTAVWPGEIPCCERSRRTTQPAPASSTEAGTALPL